MPEERGNDGDWAEVLRDHGYLESGVERLFGRPGATGLGPLLRVALRFGLLAGPACGLSLIVLHLGADRDLLAEPARLARLALFALLGAAVTDVLLGAPMLLAMRGARRGGRRALAAAGGLVAFSWVALSWRHLRAADLFEADRLRGDLVALAAGIGLGLLVFRLLGAAGRVLSGSGGPPPRLLPLAGAFLVLALGLAAWRLASPAEFEPRPGAAFDVVQTGRRVAWIALDGLDAGELEELLARGGVAAALAEVPEGGFVPLLLGEARSSPAETWISASTGATPAEHGVREPSARRVRWGGRGVTRDLATALIPPLLPVERRPISAAARRLPSVDEIVARKGYRVTSLGLWGSGPGDPGDGRRLLGDRALRAMVADPAAEPPAREIYPEDLGVRVAAGAGRLAALAADRRRGAIDALLLEIAVAEVERPPRERPDLLCATLPGSDLLDLGRVPDAQRAEHLDRLDRGLGALIPRLLARGYALLLTGAPGWGGESDDAEGWAWVGGEPLRAAPGAFLRVEEVAPLILSVLGFPRAEDLGARRPESLLDAGFRAGHPERGVASHGERRAGRRGVADRTREQLEVLRSLGYVGGGRGR